MQGQGLPWGSLRLIRLSRSQFRKLVINEAVYGEWTSSLQNTEDSQDSLIVYTDLQDAVECKHNPSCRRRMFRVSALPANASKTSSTQFPRRRRQMLIRPGTRGIS